MNALDLRAEMAAIQMMLLALINEHPDKRALLKTFDAVASAVQLHNAASGEVGTTPPALREALLRFRNQIADQVP
jgi:hypothetical protein